MIIKFDKVTKIYPPKTIALQDISFEVQTGEFVSIVGKSGAGKTTLTRLMLGLEKPTSGEVHFKNFNLNEIQPSKLQEIRRKIGAIYQDYKLFNTKTVFENISYVLEVEGIKYKEIKRRVFNVLEMMGLSEKKDNFPGELSSGEQQRLVIARALVTFPEIIIADEPTGNLDPYNTYEVISLFKRMNKKGATIILLTHNREIVNKLGERVITLVEGKIIRDEKEGKFLI